MPPIRPPHHRWSAFAGPTRAPRRRRARRRKPSFHLLFSATVEPSQLKIVGIQGVGSAASTPLPRRHCTATRTYPACLQELSRRNGPSKVSACHRRVRPDSSPAPRPRRPGNPRPPPGRPGSRAGRRHTLRNGGRTPGQAAPRPPGGPGTTTALGRPPRPPTGRAGDRTRRCRRPHSPRARPSRLPLGGAVWRPRPSERPGDHQRRVGAGGRPGTGNVLRANVCATSVPDGVLLDRRVRPTTIAGRCRPATTGRRTEPPPSRFRAVDCRVAQLLVQGLAPAEAGRDLHDLRKLTPRWGMGGQEAGDADENLRTFL